MTKTIKATVTVQKRYSYAIDPEPLPQHLNEIKAAIESDIAGVLGATSITIWGGFHYSWKVKDEGIIDRQVEWSKTG
jgi:hypothetical protein